MKIENLVYLQEQISRLPTAPMVRRPTPLDELTRLSKTLGDIRIFMKREDLSGLAMGGNKSRELDYFIGDALHKGTNVFIAGGGVAQSNHAVQCAAAANRVGMQPVLVLNKFRAEEIQGNYLLSVLLNADIRFVEQENVDAAINQRLALESVMQATAEEYAAKGYRPYILSSSFHPLGAIGFVDCFLELISQFNEQDLDIDQIYLTSAGATQVGLVLGSKFVEAPIQITGIAYTLTTEGLLQRMVALGNQTADLLNIPTRIDKNDLLNYNYAGPGYGIPTQEGIEAIRLLAETEGIFLDPVYTGKGMAGLINHIQIGRIPPRSTIVFIHSGGVPALFAYQQEILESSGQDAEEIPDNV